MKLHDLIIYVRSMGKAVRVVAWFPSGDEGTKQANEYVARNPDTAIVADHEGLILLARTSDRGLKIQD